MSKAKMQAAKELIQTKEYDKARAILETVDHPTARDWLQKLDAIAPSRRKRSTWSRIRLPILLVALIGAVAFGVVVIRNNQEISATSAQIMDDAFAKNRIKSILQVYCGNVTTRGEEDCVAWALDAVGSDAGYQAATDCDSLVEWASKTDEFSICLLAKGVYVLHDKAVGMPINIADLTDKNSRVISALQSSCESTNAPQRYCVVWSLTNYQDAKPTIDNCLRKWDIVQQVTGFKNCLWEAGVTA